MRFQSVRLELMYLIYCLIFSRKVRVRFWLLLLTCKAEPRRFLFEVNGLLNLYCVLFHFSYSLWKYRNYTYLQIPQMFTEVSAHLNSIFKRNSSVLMSVEEISKTLFAIPVGIITPTSGATLSNTLTSSTTSTQITPEDFLQTDFELVNFERDDICVTADAVSTKQT